MSNEDKFGPYVKKIGKKFYPQGRPTVRSENLWREKYWEVRREVDGKCYFETLNGAHGGGVIVYEISEEEFSAVKKGHLSFDGLITLTDHNPKRTPGRDHAL